MPLPDNTVAGVSMTEGKLLGLSNMFRVETAVLEERHDKVYLAFSLELTKLVASYSWQRKKMRYPIFYIFNSFFVKYNKIKVVNKADIMSCLKTNITIKIKLEQQIAH